MRRDPDRVPQPFRDPEQATTHDLVETSRRRLARYAVAANLVFILGAAVLGIVVLPSVDAPRDGGRLVLNGVLIVAYTTAAVVAALRWNARRLREGWAWSDEGRDPTVAEQRRVLRTPIALAELTARQWGGALVVFAAANAPTSPRFALSLAATILFTGLAMCAVAYLLAEVVLRPLAARILAARPADEPALLGVLQRQTLGWVLGTGSSVVGLLVVGVLQLVDPRASTRELAFAVVVFCAIALAGGLTLQVVAAKAVAKPLRGLRAAAAELREGDLSVRVEVDDATDVGQLQDGFNRMVSGLEERERLRDVFGRHVGDDVARYALGDRGTELGGETRDVGVLFVDLVGSTALAAARPPEEVVAVLNRFFAVVIAAVDEQGGSINKFEGDAALAVFGAPDDLDDPPGAALAAARTMATRLAAEIHELGFGIGVASGPAVAGNVGGERRFEYTVIGDPVNEAARLSDLAKELDGGVAASGRTLEAARRGGAGDRGGGGDLDSWRHARDVVLRGRSEPTAVMTPAA